MYWFRSSTPIFAAMSGNSLGFSIAYARPPVCSARSFSSPGPMASSGVRLRAPIGSKMPIA